MLNLTAFGFTALLYPKFPPAQINVQNIEFALKSFDNLSLNSSNRFGEKICLVVL